MCSNFFLQDGLCARTIYDYDAGVYNVMWPCLLACVQSMRIIIIMCTVFNLHVPLSHV